MKTINKMRYASFMEGEQVLYFVGLSGDIFESPLPLEGVVRFEVECKFDGPSANHWFDQCCQWPGPEPKTGKPS
jgi:hypothetical protein